MKMTFHTHAHAKMKISFPRAGDAIDEREVLQPRVCVHSNATRRVTLRVAPQCRVTPITTRVTPFPGFSTGVIHETAT